MLMRLPGTGVLALLLAAPLLTTSPAPASQQPDGSWRISGCHLTQSPDLSV